MDVLKELGVMAFGSRLKRLLDRLNKDVSLFYRTLGLGFQPHWFSTLYLLGRRSPMTVTGIAEALGYSHPAVTKLAGQMARAGLVSSSRGRDRRERRLALTGKGRRMIETLEPVWGKIGRSMAGIIAESGFDLVAALDALEAGLERQSLLERLTGTPSPRPSDEVEILDYRPAFKKDFERLNSEWLKAPFEVEKYDTDMLSDPEGNIIGKGGAVFFARRKGKIVGTCALIKHPDGIWELAKLAVTERARRKRVGTALALSAANRARDLGAERLCLETYPKDTRAAGFFESLGFKKADGHRLPPRYRRPRLTMEWDLLPPP